MNDCIIIDSNTVFATKLYKHLTDTQSVNDNIIDTRDITRGNLSILGNQIFEKIKNNKNPDILILVNAETEINDAYLETQPIIDLLFWLRCKYNCKNPIVIYSCIPLAGALKRNPENFILASPGCYFLDIPNLLSQVDKIKGFKPLTNLVVIKPHLKTAINLVQVRHRYANYAGIGIMQLIAKAKHDIEFDTDILIEHSDYDYSRLNEFINSLEYRILKFYFDLNIADIKKYNSDIKLSVSGKILLIDDLANEGWQPVLSQMIYGNPNASDKLISVNIEVTKDGKFDKAATICELDSKIEEHKPHLILLDLRLNDEEGKKLLPKFGGYQLLKYIKTNPKYKGVPVIMFTASSNAQTVKNLIANGAYCVWTKPGLDESLTSYEIVKRYEQLLTLIDNIFNPKQDLLDLVNDNYNIKFDINEIDLEAIRADLFRKLDFIKYRHSLYSVTPGELEKITPSLYNSVNVIYIDANTFLSGNKNVNYCDLISSIYKLCALTSKSKLNFLTDSKISSGELPKVVIMNAVIDEVIKTAKVKGFARVEKKNNATNVTTFQYYDLVFARAMFSQMVIKELLNSKFIRTEFYQPGIPNFLRNPKEAVYADPYILDDIANLIGLNNSAYVPNTKVLFISGDNKLKNKLKAFNDSSKNNLITMDIKEFINEMTAIKF